LREELKRYK